MIYILLNYDNNVNNTFQFIFDMNIVLFNKVNYYLNIPLFIYFWYDVFEQESVQ